MEKLLRELTSAYGPAGFESGIREVIESYLKGHVDRCYSDALGNLIAVKEGSAPRLMLAAHMDELGLMVTHIDENGFLRFSSVGGITPQLLVGQRFIFANGTAGTVYHEKIDDYKELKWPKLYMDIGALNGEEASQKVKVGDVAVYGQELRDLGHRFMGKSMDDRAGCAVLIETLRRLGQGVSRELVFVFTVQEELGLRGARTAAYHLEPSYALAVDVTRVGDTPKARVMEVSLGKGPAVKVKDSSLITHPKIRQIMIEQAEEHGIPYQLEVLERGGTDAGVIQLTRQGIPSGVLSIPCRYVHTPSEMVDKRDMENAVNFLEKLCRYPW